MASLDGFQFPPPAVLQMIEEQQRSGAEVRPAPTSPNKIDIDPKNPVLVIQKKTVWRVNGVFKDGEKKEIVSETKKQLTETKEMEIKRKYKKLHEIIDEEEQLKNIDKLLKTQIRWKLFETHIYSLYGGWFDKDGNIILKWNQVIIKWTPKYNQMVEKALVDFRYVWHVLLTDAEERWQDPDTIRKLP